MEISNTSFRILRATLCAAVITVVFITAITLTGEFYPWIKDWLKMIFSHHWIGKGILAGIVYAATAILFSLIPPPADEKKATKLTRCFSTLALVSALGTFFIYGFFFYETFLKH